MDHCKRMDVCQSGFHDQELQRRLVKVPVEGGHSVILCDFCLSRIMEAQQQGGRPNNDDSIPVGKRMW